MKRQGQNRRFAPVATYGVNPVVGLDAGSFFAILAHPQCQFGFCIGVTSDIIKGFFRI